MKLEEIKPLKESTAPIHIVMLLQEVVNAGKVTNMTQYVALSQIVQLVKLGNPKPRYMYENPTPKSLLDEMKELSGEDQVKLAEWCLARLAVTDAQESMERFCNPHMALSQWIAYVTKAQD